MSDLNGAVVEYLLNLFNLVCLNDGWPTRVQINSVKQSYLDLMIVSEELVGKREWELLDSINMGNDHFITLGTFG